MKAFKWAVAVIAIVMFLLVLIAAKTPNGSPTFDTLPVVKVLVTGGHGSGALIGNGYILTAGHVTTNTKKVKVETQDGRSFEADVLWSNHGDKSYDVALLYVKELADEPFVELSCGPSYWGQEIIVIGNPKQMAFITTWGRVSGKTWGELDQWWRELIALDVTATHGVSGGPVLDAKTGKLVGLLVAGYPGTGYTFMAPAASACHLMARGV